MRRLRWAPLLLVFSLFLFEGEAEAQYKNGQFGFDAGYHYIGKNSQLDPNSFLLAMRGGYKGTDHWWFTARAGVGFRGEQNPLSQRTVVLFHLMPVDARYYFFTDTFRPYVGVGSTFTFLFNQTIESTVFWGPNVVGGAEFRLQRDLFLGIEVDAGWNFVFEGPDAPFVTASAQVIFFL